MAEIPKIAQQRIAGQQFQGAVSHPDADLLSAFAEQALSTRERDQVLAHLVQCADCRDIAVLAGVAAPEAAVVEAAPTGKHALSKGQRSLWSWRPLRWTAAAATAVVVLSAVWLNRKEAPRQELTVGSETLPGVVRPLNEPVPAASVPAADLKAQSQTQPVGESAPKLEAPVKKKPAPVTAIPQLVGPTNKDLNSDALAERKQEANQVANEKDTLQLPNNGRSFAKLDQLQAPKTPQNQSIGGPRMTAGAAAATRDFPTKTFSANGVTQAAPATPPITMTYSRQGAAELAPATAVAEGDVLTAQNNGQILQRGPVNDDEVPPAANPVQKITPNQNAESEPQLRKSAVSSASVVNPRWRVTQEGQLQQSSDSGQTWHTVLGENVARFRTVASFDAVVWAGGDSGEFWSSSNSGKTWRRIVASVYGHSPKGNVQKIELANPTTVMIKTSAGETWTTTNGGLNWTVKYE